MDVMNPINKPLLLLTTIQNVRPKKKKKKKFVRLLTTNSTILTTHSILMMTYLLYYYYWRRRRRRRRRRIVLLLTNPVLLWQTIEVQKCILYTTIRIGLYHCYEWWETNGSIISATIENNDNNANTSTGCI